MRIKEQLKIEIDHLDESYLQLLYNITCQFPHVENQRQREVSNQHIADLFQNIADNGGLGINDPKKWQQEIREDRALPFREI